MAAWIIPLVAAAASAYFGKKGADQQAEAAGQAAANAENARKEAKIPLTDNSVYRASEWLFPNLLPKPPQNKLTPVSGPGVKEDLAADRILMGQNYKPKGSGLTNALWRNWAQERNGSYVPPGVSYQAGELPPGVYGYDQETPSGYGYPVGGGTGNSSGSQPPPTQQGMTTGQPLGSKPPRMPQGNWMIQAGKVGQALKGRRAEGGPVEGNQPYMVGEEGPEVVVPEQDGMVIPNDAMPPEAGGRGGGMEGAMGGMPGMGGPEEGGEEMQQIIMMIVQAVIQAMMEGGQGGMPSEGMGQPDMGMDPMAAMGGGAPPMEGGMGGEMPIPRATGGPVRSGQRYRVGEQGPETMVPMGGVQQPQPQGNSVLAPQNYSSLGQGEVDRSQQMMNNPGQLSSVAYERDQEQANQGLNALTQATQGSLTGGGVDPNTPMGQSLTQSAVLSSNKQRNEAARDYSLAQESLGREDIQTAMANYANMLQLVFGLQGMRSTAAGGQAFPQVQPVDTYAPYARGVSALGYGLNDYFKNKGGGGGGGEAQPGTNQSDAWTGKQF